MTDAEIKAHIAHKNRLKRENKALRIENERLKQLYKREKSIKQMSEIIEKKTTTMESDRIAHDIKISQKDIESIVLDCTDAIVFREIGKHVCSKCLVDYSTLFEKSRKRERVFVRNIIRYYLKFHFKNPLTLKSIGVITGGCDHATVLHSIEEIKNISPYDKTTKLFVEDCIKEMIAIEQKIRVYDIVEFNKFSL